LGIEFLNTLQVENKYGQNQKGLVKKSVKSDKLFSLLQLQPQEFFC